MKMKLTPALLAIVALLTLPLQANAAIVTYIFGLDATQEVPANGSPALGTASVTIDDVLNTASFLVTGLGLTGTPVAAHIHNAPAGVNGPVVFDLVANLDGGGLVFGFPGSVAITGSDKSLAAGLGALINATPWDFYINLHTDAFPGGEIRGQLAAVPVPAALWLFGSALVGVGGLRRRSA